VLFLVLACCVAVPILEFAVFLEIADRIGGWEALVVLVGMSLLGVWMVKVQGVGVIRRMRAELSARQVPGRAIVDGGLILVAAGLLVIPGFATATLGLLLLTPPVRAAVREALVRRWTRRYGLTRTVSASGPIRVESVVVRRERNEPGGSEPQELGRQRAIEPGSEPVG
jgi:UPF0716 protein FxsA